MPQEIYVNIATVPRDGSYFMDAAFSQRMKFGCVGTELYDCFEALSDLVTNEDKVILRSDAPTYGSLFSGFNQLPKKDLDLLAEWLDLDGFVQANFEVEEPYQYQSLI